MFWLLGLLWMPHDFELLRDEAISPELPPPELPPFWRLFDSTLMSWSLKFELG